MKYSGDCRHELVVNGAVQPATAHRCEILVPVFNGYESVRRCLDSVLVHSPPECAIRVLDDASSDLRLLDWLDALVAREPRLSVSRFDENLGFVGNVNRGLASARGDVILLNSDTVVTPGWVEKLLACAASDPRIALVCPLSNNATILSMPRMNGDDPIPDGLGIERFGALVESCSVRRYPRLPVAVGFCMLIRWPALQRLGLLHRAYHRGYGEECDYSLRAWEAGFEVACSDDTFVYHEGEQSFGTVAGMDGVKRRNESVLLARWPFYHALVRRFCQLDPLRDVRERVLTGLARARGDRAPHILHLLHSYHALGGTELHSRALVEGLSETYRTTVLFPDEIGPDQDYHCVVDHGLFRVLAYRRAATVGRPRLFGQVAALRNVVVEASFARMIAGGEVDLVHVQHLLHWGTLELPLIARRLGAVVVLSLHDYFLFCPVFDMLRPDGRPCGKARADADDPECLDCLARQAPADEGTDGLGDYLRERHAKLLEIFAATDALVSPSRFVLERFRRAYGGELAARMHVVPHGLPQLGPAPKPSHGRAFRLGVFANLSRRKGADRLLETIGLLRHRRDIEILQFGGVDPAYQASLDAAGVHRQGVYRLQDLPRLVSGVDLALVPSIYEETFCLTIAELQALGVPVLAFGVGAIPERIQDGVTGFLVAESSARALAERIERLVAKPEPLRQVRARLREYPAKSMASNVLDYAELYARLLDARANRSRASLNEILTGLESDPVAGTPVEMSAALLEQLAPDWGRWHAGYGTPAYRRWLESQGCYEPPCHGLDSDAPFSLLMVIQEFEREREPGAIAATLESLSTGADIARGLQCLIVSLFDPPPLTQTQTGACIWLRIERDQSVARRVNRWLAGWQGDWIGWMVAGDRLHPAVLGLLRGHVVRSPEWRLIYTDEDEIAEDGRRYRPRFKPDFDLDLLRSQFYIGDLCLIERRAFLECGGLSHQIEVALQDLCLKVVDRFGESAIGHVPHVLYHRADSRHASSPAPDAVAKILVAHLERRRIRAQVRATSAPGIHWIDHPVSPEIRTTLLVLTQGDTQAVAELIDSVRAALGRLEILVLDFQRKGSLPTPSRVLAEAGAVRWRRAESSENIAHSLNRAIRSLDTERVLVVHDGLRARPNSALPVLLGLIERPDVALAGPCILDSEGRILQGYPLMGFWPLGVMGQLHRGQTLGGTDGSLNRHLCVQRCASVSDQAFVLWRAAFEQAGGFDESGFPNAWYLLDLGLRLTDLGYRTLWSPHATLVAEAGRGRFQGYRRRKLKELEVADEVARLYERWLPRLARDPAYNPNLSLRDLSAEPETETEIGLAWESRLCEVPRLLGFPGDHSGSGHYRVIDPLITLRTRGLACCALVPADKPTRPPSVVELERLAPDTLLLHNALHDRHLHALELYRRYNDVRLVFALDDLITDLPSWNPFGRTNYRDIDRRLDRALGLCDRLLLSTPLLAEFYGRRHDDVRVVPNRLPRARWQGLIDVEAVPDRSGRKPRIGWAGAAQHDADLEWLAPVVEALADEVEWYFLGMCPDGLKPYATAVQPMVEFERYPSVLAGLGLDVAIAPLALHDFNRCKSQLKLLEYGVLGIPVVCTDIEPYREAPVERLPNRPHRWIEALRARLADLESARREGRELRRWVESGWMLDDALSSWIEALSPGPS